MNENKLIGQSKGTSMVMPASALGAPGVQGNLIIVAQFKDRVTDDHLRMSDTSPREFEVKARLSRNAELSSNFAGDFDKNSGGSYLTVTGGVDHLKFGIGASSLRLDVNSEAEISMASAMMTARTAEQARIEFSELLARYLDRMSYLGRVPAFAALVVVRDVRHEVQYIHYVSPPQPVTVGAGGEELDLEMRTVYALYREALNASSPYYRVLCLHKIMEGLLGPLRTGLFKRAKAAGIDVRREKLKVPAHADLPEWLNKFVDEPMKEFYDGFLSKQYRDAMAHFVLREKSALDVSSPIDASRFTDVAFMMDLCARALIAQHEAWLGQVQATEVRSA